jgi:hypothetical protein
MLINPDLAPSTLQSNFNHDQLLSKARRMAIPGVESSWTKKALAEAIHNYGATSLTRVNRSGAVAKNGQSKIFKDGQSTLLAVAMHIRLEVLLMSFCVCRGYQVRSARQRQVRNQSENPYHPRRPESRFTPHTRHILQEARSNPEAAVCQTQQRP